MTIENHEHASRGDGRYVYKSYARMLLQCVMVQVRLGVPWCCVLTHQRQHPILISFTGGGSTNSSSRSAVVDCR